MFPDVITGQLDSAVSTLTSAAPIAREGRVRAYGVSSPQRHLFASDMPIFAEQAPTQGMAMEVWQAVFAPAATDPAFTARVAAALAMPDFQQKILAIGQTPSIMGPAPLATFQREEGERYAALVRAAKIAPQ